MESLVQYVAVYGLPLIFAVVLIKRLGAPIPAIPLFVVAGALAVEGDVSALRVLAVAVAACLLGDTPWFLLGRRQGMRILKTICRVSLSPDSCVRQTEAVFERWGMPSLLFAKFIPGFSTVAPPLAGATGASLPAFLLWTGVGALLWTGAGVAGGMVFHRAVDRVLAYLTSIGSAAFGVLTGALLLFMAFKWWQRRRFYKTLRMARITVEELRRLIDGGRNPTVLDVRTDGARERDPRRIPGAAVLAAHDLDADLSQLPRDREIILYCT